MLCGNKHLALLMGVIGLLLLIRWRFILPSTFSLPPLVTLEQIIVLSFCGLLISCACKADTTLVWHYSDNNSKNQHITISTPNGR
ncbi:SCVP9 [Saguaro cactus virus]|uniref:SCVP9 n=1 Tax=Saguaro cactus virus TaxID=52274 RepID=P89110_9TOMB|nr:SCVP9 [Saguaro cactus virus]AAB36711.1 SCVP9 [Saguaro cactus virus]